MAETDNFSQKEAVVEYQGCTATELTKISPQHARTKILGGKSLENAELEELDLSGCEIPTVVSIKQCRIGRLKFDRAVFEEALFVEQTTILDQAEFSNRDIQDQFRETAFCNHVRFQDVVFGGSFTCIKATFQKEFTCNAKFCGKTVFNNFTFEDDIQWNQSLFERGFEARHCHFGGMAWMRSLRSTGKIHFTRSTFDKRINLRYSQFDEEVFFSYVLFHQRAGFNAIHSKARFVLDNSQFYDEFTSKGSRYEGQLSLRSCQAHDVLALTNSSLAALSFDRLECKGKFIATGATFSGRVNIDSARFAGEFDFSDAVFDNNFLCRHSSLGMPEAHVRFHKAHFKREVDFAYSSLCAGLDFSAAVFAGKATFQQMTLGTAGNFVTFEKTQFQRRASFEGTNFVGHTIFQNAQFVRRAGFERSVWNHITSFADVSFGGRASFLEAQFLKPVAFHGCRFDEVDFTDAEFAGAVCFAREKHIDRDNPRPSIFHGEANFATTRFVKKAIFQKVEFKKTARFNNAYFGEQTSFWKTKFQEDAVFSGTFCSMELDLREIVVDKELVLKGANISRRLNLADAEFSGIAFYNMVTDVISITPQQVRGKLRGERENCPPLDVSRTSQEYLVLKKSFSYRGMHQEEDWAYWNFRRCARRASSLAARRDRKWPKLVKNFVEKILLDYGSSYGTHPLRITLLAGVLILGFGVFYWGFSEQIILEGNEIKRAAAEGAAPTPTLPQCIYFSTMAFTTMGFGDVHPDFFGWLKAVVALEALIGIITMTLFVGTYARKIIR